MTLPASLWTPSSKGYVQAPAEHCWNPLHFASGETVTPQTLRSHCGLAVRVRATRVFSHGLQTLTFGSGMWEDIAFVSAGRSIQNTLPANSPRAAIADDILNSGSNATVAYHFFRDDQPESLVDVLRHLVYQQLSQPTGISKVALDLHRKSKSYNAMLLPKDLINVLCDVASTSGRSYLILDGIDEFPHFSKLLKHLPRLAEAGTHVLVASRDLPSIKSLLSDAIHLDARAGADDVKAYVEWRLEEEADLDDTVFTDDLKQDICTKLAEHVNGS